MKSLHELLVFTVICKKSPAACEGCGAFVFQGLGRSLSRSSRRDGGSPCYSPCYSVTFALRRANFFGSLPIGTVRVMVSKPAGLFSVTTTPESEFAVVVPTV